MTTRDNGRDPSPPGTLRAWRGTLLLATCFVALCYAAYRDVAGSDPNASWTSILAEQDPTPQANDIVRLFDFLPTDVRALHIHSGGRSFSGTRGQSSWPARWDELVEALSELAVILELNPPEHTDLAAYGLSEARHRVEIALHDGSARALSLGDRNPSATGVYAKIEPDDRLVLTGAVALWEIENALQGISTTPAPRPHKEIY